jgi:glycosyltransferase involved in cell wall biosynthesis
MRAVPQQGRKLIAYWVWEMPQVPPTWQRAFRLANEIWVPTNFVADALRTSGCQTPIRVVPYPVRAPVMPDVALRDDATPLRVLTVFAYDSGFERKNPIAAVAAFREAFGDRTDVELLVKVRGHSTTGEPERRFAAAIAGMANVRVQAGSIAPGDYERLLADADIVLSLHRAEGFGLVLAEAMLLGKPVVCTAWSGNLDFMNEMSACLVPATLTEALDESDAYRDLRTHWAEPSIAAAADWLRRLEDAALRRSIGDAARHHATQCLGLERFREAVTASLGAAA